MSTLTVGVFLSFIIYTSTAFAQDRAITNISGDVYRFQNNNHYSIFVITEDGVVVTDPINTEAALWLRSEISKLTDKPIKYLLYSHSHGDHASGGAAFGEVPNVIAQANAPEKIDGVTITDRIEEATTVEAGDKSIELVPLGPGHGTDLMAMVVRPENVAFVVDAVAAKRLPYRDFPNSNVDDWTDQVRKVEALEFDILSGGHGPVGEKSDVTDGRIYLEKLREQVLTGLKAGNSVDDLVGSITMDEYKHWAAYDQWLELNIRGMARHLTEIDAINN